MSREGGDFVWRDGGGREFGRGRGCYADLAMPKLLTDPKFVTELVTDCPRCRAKRITFEISAQSKLHSGKWEAFSVCRECRQATIFVFGAMNPPLKFERVNPRWIIRHVSVADFNTWPSPEHLPDPIEAAFEEGAKCLAIDCFNAAATMFRLALDIATRDESLFKDAERPTWWTKRTLGPRLAWLFENEILPKRLQALASVVKDDGNDGAHEGTVNKKSAEELVNFTERLLTELYTEPERIKMAVARRAEPNDEGA